MSCISLWLPIDRIEKLTALALEIQGGLNTYWRAFLGVQQRNRPS
jgi:hypothetical protein